MTPNTGDNLERREIQALNRYMMVSIELEAVMHLITGTRLEPAERMLSQINLELMNAGEFMNALIGK